MDSTIMSTQAGIGLRAPHYREVLDTLPPVGFLEVHSENFFGDGGAPLHYLEQVREHYAVSLHGVGLSIGSTDPLSEVHLKRLVTLIRRVEPALVSEHLCWGSVGGRFHNDLLPLPYTEEALDHMTARVARVQDRLGRRLLIENISAYLEFRQSRIPEWEFLSELSRRTGCALLLDVNNVYVNARNHGFDPLDFLDGVPREAVLEIHLAGHTVNRVDGLDILIDTHNRPVCAEVWSLYEQALERLGPIPTLIEWDSELPPLTTLLAEAGRARTLLEARHEPA